MSRNIRPRRRLTDLYAKGKEVRFSPAGAAVYDHQRDKRTGEVARVLESVYNLDSEQIDLTAPDTPNPPWVDDAAASDLVANHDKPGSVVSDDDVDALRDVVVWVQPPNAQQREQALRESQAERSRAILKARRDTNSPEHITTDSFIGDMSLDTLIDYILMSDEGDRREEAQRKVLMKEEWKSKGGKDDDPTHIGFAELQDAMRQWDEAGSPDTEEWKALIDRDAMFGIEVEEELDRLRETSRASLALLSRADLEERATRRRVELLGNQAFMARYEREMIFAACRDFEHRTQPYWDSVEEMFSDDEYGLGILNEVYGSFIQNAAEAKNVQRAAPGSPSVEPPAEPETSEASTPAEQTE